ncbi:class I SAM-dependent methyltransferase [Nocardioides sp. R1-1]|uniref:class I SAM-dependent methyltransferase n=1 Tax=Nocardioides sp. R1-1 TaxID=3383502 RepID=UPI0038D1FE55
MAGRVLRRIADEGARSSSTLAKIAGRPLRRLLDAQDARLELVARGLVEIGGIVDQDRRHAQERLRALKTRIKDLERRVDAVATAHDRIDELARRLDVTDGAVARLDTEQQATPFVAPGTRVRAVLDGGREVLALGADREAAYADFEDTYRGSEAFVRERLASYVSIVGDGPVLDLGCGRGEFLELMEAAAVPARGIDLDESMAARARAKGLDVVTGDGLAALRDTEPGTLGAVTSFQVIEHIPVSAVRELFLGAAAALRPGGVLVAETVNPHSPAALKTFWLDLTHVRPLFPESLLFLARETGFDEAWIHLPQGSGDLDRDLRLCGEYALVARKG